MTEPNSPAERKIITNTIEIPEQDQGGRREAAGVLLNSANVAQEPVSTPCVHDWNNLDEHTIVPAPKEEFGKGQCKGQIINVRDKIISIKRQEATLIVEVGGSFTIRSLRN